MLAQLPLWLAAAQEVREQWHDPYAYVEPVARWVPWTVVVVAAALSVAVLLLAVGLRLRPARRAGMVVGAAALLAASVGWSGFTENVTGPWYVGLSASAGALALLAAAGPRAADEPGPSRARRLLVGTSLVAAGAFLAWTCRQGAAYWQWRADSAGGYLAGLAVGVLLAVLGLLVVLSRAGWLSGGLRPVGLVAGVVGLALWALGGVLLSEMEVLYQFEESEVALSFATPAFLAGTGVLAAAAAAWRRRADLAGFSVSAAVTFGLLALWQESTWGRLMA